jgi:tagatose 1,6-diphosphate aldolase
MQALSVGKIRGLQQISTRDGIFTMCAMDHRSSLKTMIEKEQGKQPDYREMVEYKLDLCAALAPHASAVLLDPVYGAPQCITGGVLPRDTGLLVSIEATDYENTPDGRITRLLKGWSVEKIKRMGASAVKILVYYRPDLSKAAAKQRATIKRLAKECLEYDIPFLVEPKTYALKDENPRSAEFAAKRPSLVIDTVRQLTSLPFDVLKVEFPADFDYETNEKTLLKLCHQLDEASQTPWVILSAGIDYPAFRKEVELACRAGASGFLGGRAIWQEIVSFRDRKARTEFLSTTVVDRLKELAEIATKYGTPWCRKLNIREDSLTTVPEGWYREY